MELNLKLESTCKRWAANCYNYIREKPSRSTCCFDHILPTTAVASLSELLNELTESSMGFTHNAVPCHRTDHKPATAGEREITMTMMTLAIRTAPRSTYRCFSTSTSAAAARYTEAKPTEAGPGGRSSVSGTTVAVFGAGGFLGRYVCSNLGEVGTKTYIGNRGDGDEYRHLRPMFDLGRSRQVFYSPRDRDSMAQVIADADVVINLIGKSYETMTAADTKSFPYIKFHTNYSFTEANVTIPQTVAELCTEMQVDNLIHVSSMAAKPDATSDWAKSKYEGECAVKEAYPWVTTIRPTQLFGYEDKLLNWFATIAGAAPVVPLIDGGHALTQPVFMDDVATTICKVVENPEKYEGKTIDCFGNRDFTYKELAEFVFDVSSQFPKTLDVPKPIMKKLAQFTQFAPLPMANVLTPDMVELWASDYTAPSQEWYAAQEGQDKILTMQDLGISQTPIEKVAFRYLHRYRSGGHFALADGYHGVHEQK